jgi:undecaprenyl-diphosphatase
MGIVLYAADRLAKHRRPLTEITVKDGIIVGFAQCMALIPGSSRSGSTLIGAYSVGLTREAAVRFSFLLSIPAVLLSGLFELYKAIKPDKDEIGVIPEVIHPTPLLISTIVAGIVGYITIAWLLKYLSKHSTLVFVVYRVLLGILLFALLSIHYIQD